MRLKFMYYIGWECTCILTYKNKKKWSKIFSKNRAIGCAFPIFGWTWLSWS